MPKRRPKGRSSRSPRPIRRRPQGPVDAGVGRLLDELVQPLDEALDDPQALAFLRQAAMFAGVLQAGDIEGPERLDPDSFLRMLVDVDVTATDALLAALAVLIPDVVPLQGARHDLPSWLVRMREARIAAAGSIVEPLRDADNLLLEVRLADEQAFTLIGLVDHNLGTVVKDAFPLPGTLAEVTEDIRLISPELTAVDEDPAEVATRVAEALARADLLTGPPPESDTWPACRPLLEWALRMAPPGGHGWALETVSDGDIEALAAEIVAGASMGPDAQDVVATLLDFAATTALHDPLRWSPTSVEILLTEWLPRVAPVGPEWRAQVPAALRATVRFAHARRGAPEDATEATLLAVELWWQESPLAPPGPELRIHSVEREAGGRAALDALSVAPLPEDEPLDVSGLPADVVAAAIEVGGLVDTAVMAMFADPELRTAARRVLARALVADPSILRRRGSPAQLAAAVTWIAAKANDRFTQATVDRIFFRDPSSADRPPVRVKDLAAHFGISGSPSTRARPILAALGRSWPDATSRDLGDPALLTSSRRASMMQQRDFLRLFGQ